MKKLLILLILIPLGIGSISCNKLQKKDPCTQEIYIAQLEMENQYLTAENTNLRQKLSDCEASKTTPTRTTTSRPRTTPAPRATPRTVAPTTSPEVDRDPVPQATAPDRTPRVGVANLDYLRYNGEIQFCVSANGREDRYFPHLAIERGVEMKGHTESNKILGYNWKVEPTEFYEGDFGVTFDGVFYVSDVLVRETLKTIGEQLSSLKIKCHYTQWVMRDMVLDSSSGYWLFKTSP